MTLRHKMAAVTTAASVLALLLAVMASPLAAASQATRNAGLFGWIAVGPRLVDDGFVGGITCNCNGEGEKNCPADGAGYCMKGYGGCIASSGLPLSNYCVSGGNYNYCGGIGCKVTGVEYCTGVCN